MVHFRNACLAVLAMVGAEGLRGGALLAPAGGRCEGCRNGGVFVRRGGECVARGLPGIRRGKDVAAGRDGAGFVVGPPHADEEDVEDGRLTLGQGARLEELSSVEEPLRGIAQEENEDADGWEEVGLQPVGRWAGQDAGHGGMGSV